MESNNTKKLFNIHTEQLVLGSILLNEEDFYKIHEVITDADFHFSLHKTLFQNIQKILKKDFSITTGILDNALINEDTYIKAGGEEYLSKILQMAFSVVDLDNLVKILKDLSLKRQLVDVAKKLIAETYNSDISLSAIDQINLAEASLYQLGEKGYKEDNFRPIAKSLEEAISSIDKAKYNPNHVVGLASRLIDLDKILAGFQRSDLIIVAGRPSMGKTALVINIAIGMAKENYKIGFFSLEMSSEQIATRILAIESGIDISSLKTGFIKEEQYNQIRVCASKVEEYGLYIDDTPALSISKIRAKARKAKKQHGLDALIIDYLQLINPDSPNSNRVLEIAEITQGLKAIAKELDIPVIVPSQLSRAVESRIDKRPMLSDLRESGTIEQDADVVMFIYREEYYLKRSLSKSSDMSDKDSSMHDKTLLNKKLKDVENLAEIIIAKHRNGPVGTILLSYIGQITRFNNYIKNIYNH